MTISIPTPEHLSQAAREFIKAFPDRKVFAFDAPMGTGKTTFIKALCEELGVADTVNSPTFAIINEYRREPEGSPVFHLDLYRIRNIAEAHDMGLEEYFYSGAPCFIEWPEVADALLPPDTQYIYIRAHKDGSRTVTDQKPAD